MPGFESRAVNPVTSRYTGFATPAPRFIWYMVLYIPYILESNPHAFYSFRGLKIICGLESRVD